MSKSQPTPEPVVTSTVCSLCDEPWDAHGANPTVLDCIRLLKMKCVSTSRWWSDGWVYPQFPGAVPCGGWDPGPVTYNLQNTLQDGHAITVTASPTA